MAAPADRRRSKLQGRGACRRQGTAVVHPLPVPGHPPHPLRRAPRRPRGDFEQSGCRVGRYRYFRSRIGNQSEQRPVLQPQAFAAPPCMRRHHGPVSEAGPCPPTSLLLGDRVRPGDFSVGKDGPRVIGTSERRSSPPAARSERELWRILRSILAYQNRRFVALASGSSRHRSRLRRCRRAGVRGQPRVDPAGRLG